MNRYIYSVLLPLCVNIEYEDTAQGKAFSGIGKNFVRELYSEIENKKERDANKIDAQI